LNSPGYKKYGDGQRVKKVVIYDHWNEMTKRKESIYGSEYEYTTIKEINGKPTLISSGVAAYEPILGAEENPLRLPIEYGQQAAAWAPVDMGYAESPMGESFYPAPTVGYSVVRKRSIHNKKIRSKTGYEETSFYTAYDFPTISEFSLLNTDTKRTYKPLLNNLLKIDAKHHLVMTQGFKVELNDMHGRMKSQKIYAETDSANAPSSSITHYYHVDDQQAEIKHLNNTVLVMRADGIISGDAIIGKDMELMMDMRQNYFSSNSLSAQANVDVFTWAPVLSLPMLWAIPQSEENIFRSSAAMKVINRHGILDRVEVIDKGSKVRTENLLYDGETGEVILTVTQNEFGDPIYNFNYPAGWMYEGMSGAYKNINAVMEYVNIRAGKITNEAISKEVINDCFYSGDEILTYGKNKVNDSDCAPVPATFPNSGKIWAVDANALKGGTPDIYFMDEEGAPYSGNDVSLKVIRSGRKNIAASAGTVTMMKNPLVKTGNSYQLIINKQSKIINASMVEYKQNWQVQDRKKQKIICAY
jgi:hypothetical protein